VGRDRGEGVEPHAPRAHGSHNPEGGARDGREDERGCGRRAEEQRCDGGDSQHGERCGAHGDALDREVLLEEDVEDLYGRLAGYARRAALARGSFFRGEGLWGAHGVWRDVEAEGERKVTGEGVGVRERGDEVLLGRERRVVRHEARRRDLPPATRSSQLFSMLSTSDVRASLGVSLGQSTLPRWG